MAHHPLHTPDLLARYPELSYSNRRTGRTTVLCLRLLANAIQHPGMPLHILDHVGTVKANHAMMHDLRDMIQKLEFQHFVVKADGVGHFTIQFG